MNFLPFHWLISKYALFVINVQRITDHIWRKVTGLPQIKRSLITPNIFVGGQYSKKVFNKFKEHGITGVVNMRMTSIHKEMDVSDVHILHLPTPDHHAPSQKDLENGVKFIQKEIDAGGKVYIHCHYGEGRGPSMAIAYLISTGLTYEDAYEHVRAVRTFIRPTEDQIIALKAFDEKLKKEREESLSLK